MKNKRGGKMVSKGLFLKNITGEFDSLDEVKKALALTGRDTLKELKENLKKTK